MEEKSSERLLFANVAFPISGKSVYTYRVPVFLLNKAQIGVRVVAPFGRRALTGFIIELFNEKPTGINLKEILEILDEQQIFSRKDLLFYRWLSEYYMSSLGDALNNSVPSGLSIESQKLIIADIKKCRDMLNQKKFKSNVTNKILETLIQNERIKLNRLQKIIGKKNIYSSVKTLEKIKAVQTFSLLSSPKVKEKNIAYVKLAVTEAELYLKLKRLEKKAPKQVAILLALIEAKDEIPQRELLNKTKAGYSSLKGLVKEGIVKLYFREIERLHSETYREDLQFFELTKEQLKIIEEVNAYIEENKFKTFLLHGVTGSGKTQVYIELSKKALEMKKTVLILVPEIALTPQITKRFYNNFGSSVAVIHSKLSPGERYDTWRAIIKGKYSIVIGPRSALFSPIKNIGLIVVDEEHDPSYKQFESQPKYNARDAAIMKASIFNCPILLGSATPSVESMYNALSNKYKLLELKVRVDNATLPEVKLVNVIIEAKKKKMQNIFSGELLNKIKERILKKESVIILQNRRGFATQLYCNDCGEILICDECSVPMIFHLKTNRMRCHYCGASRAVPKVCANCGSSNIRFFGTGTQRVEDELLYYFPKVRIERVDSDTILQKGKLSRILNKFKSGEIDILVGTQMVSKGLDFSNVTLVGVISAETTLWLPDFRADERTFQLLTQVAGRAGRSKKKGEVIIQTQNHKNFVLQKVLMNDYAGFYEREIKLRELNGYPPFTRLCLIETKSKNQLDSLTAIKKIYEHLIKERAPLLVSTPHEAIIFRIKGEYRYQILIKVKKEKDPSGRLLRGAINNTLNKLNNESVFNKIKLFVDIDPQSVM